MVTKIQPASKDIAAATEYNERKMTAEEGKLSAEEEDAYLTEGNTGHIVATYNVPETSSLKNEFTRLQWLAKTTTRGRKMQNPTFHMSINPGQNDRHLNEDEISSFAQELMTALGYEETPWRLYRHNDTDREHYHIVGIRIGQDGKKIPDAFENRRCEKKTRALAEKYGYTYGTNDKETKEQKKTTHIKEDNNSIHKKDKKDNRKKEQKETKKEFIPPYRKNPDSGDAAQYRRFHEEAMRWWFTTPEQYGMLLKYRFNTEVKIYDDGLHFTGLDDKGETATTPMTEKETGIEALNDVLDRISTTDMKPKKAQRERLEKCIREAEEKAESWADMKKLLSAKGIITCVSWNKDDKPFGITWLDRATRCAWKASETEATLENILKTADEKGWKITRSFKYEKKERNNETKDSELRKANSKKSGSLAEYSEKGPLEKLLQNRRTNKTKRDNSDASKNKAEIKYGDDREEKEIIL